MFSCPGFQPIFICFSTPIPHNVLFSLADQSLATSLAKFEQIPAIDRNILPIQILIRRGEQYRIRHIPIIPRPPRRQMRVLIRRKLALLIILALPPSRHLAREHPRRDRIDAHLDPVVRHLRRQQLVQVDGGALAGVVVEVALGFGDEAGYGGDVDDAAREAFVVLRGFLEEGEEGGGHEEELGDVGFVGVDPVVEGGVLAVEEVGFEFRACGAFGGCLSRRDAGVVDQNAEALFARLDLFD